MVVASSALPSGASTAAKQPALGTAGTASADVITVQGIASMTALKVDGSAVTQPVSAASLPLPTGASTLAEQQSQTTLLTNIDAGIPAALGQAAMAASMPVVIASNQSAVPISGTVTATPSGTQDTNITQVAGVAIAQGHGTAAAAIRVELPTDGTGVIATVGAVTAITNALPAGTNAIGKLAANSGVDIGDVDITSIAAGTNYIGKIRLTDGTTDTTVLDLTNNNPLTVAIVDGSGDQITSFGGGTQYADGAARGTATGTLAMGDDGTNIQSVHVDTAGDLQIDVLSIAAGDNNIGNVDIVTMPAVTNAGTFAVQESGAALTSLQLIDDTVFTDDTSTHATGTTKGLGIMAAATPTDTAVNANDIGMLAMTTNRELLVQVNTALPAGTNAIGKLAANSGVDIGDVDVTSIAAGTNYIGRVRLTNGTLDSGLIDETGTNAVDSLAVGGGTPHDSVDSGNPQKMGGKAVAFGSTPTEVAASDRTDYYAIRAGIPFVIGGHMNAVTLEYATTGAQTDTAIITISTGSKIVVTQIQAITDNANTAFPQMRVGFGTANTPTTTGVVLTHPGLPAGGGVSRGDGSGILGVGADNEDLRITCGAPTGGSIRVLVTYFITSS